MEYCFRSFSKSDIIIKSTSFQNAPGLFDIRDIRRNVGLAQSWLLSGGMEAH